MNYISMILVRDLLIFPNRLGSEGFVLIVSPLQDCGLIIIWMGIWICMLPITMKTWLTGYIKIWGTILLNWSISKIKFKNRVFAPFQFILEKTNILTSMYPTILMMIMLCCLMTMVTDSSIILLFTI